MLEKTKQNLQLQNVNVLANAIELATQTINKLHTDDIRSNVDANILRQAVAARLQRRVITAVKD